VCAQLAKCVVPAWVRCAVTGLDAEPFFTRRPGAEAPLGVAFKGALGSRGQRKSGGHRSHSLQQGLNSNTVQADCSVLYCSVVCCLLKAKKKNHDEESLKAKLRPFKFHIV